MKNIPFILVLTVMSSAVLYSGAVFSAGKKSADNCFESMEGRTGVKIKRHDSGRSNIKCSDTTGAVLLWNDPFDETINVDSSSFGPDTPKDTVFVRPREKSLKYFPCIMCHKENSRRTVEEELETMKPHKIMMHRDSVKDPLNMRHGKGKIWCFDCHNIKNRNKLVDRHGGEISFNQPVKLCGGCHAGVLSDFRDGIHGKRTGMWKSSGKKRWWVCTECHNPHDVEQGDKKSSFAALTPEPAPHLPKGMVKRE